MIIHRLQTDSSRPGKAIPEQLPAAEKPGRYALKNRFHFHGRVFVKPAARLDVDLLTGLQRHLKHIAKTMKPHDAFVTARRKGIYEKSGAAKKAAPLTQLKV